MPFKCNICNSVKKDYIYKKVRGYDTPKSYAVVVCKKCKVHQTYPIPSPKQLVEYYGDQAIAYNGKGGEEFTRQYVNNKIGHWRKLKLHKRLEEIRKYSPEASSIMDVGCGAGIFIDYLRSSDFDVQGIELSEWGYKIATNELGLKVHNKQLVKAGIKKGSLDVVTMYDLLEHTINPSDELAFVGKILRSGGLIILNVPNIDSYISKMTGSQWNKLIPPNHLYHFTIGSLSSLLRDNGYTILSTSTNNGDAIEFNGQLFVAIFVKLAGIIRPSLKESYYNRYTLKERNSIVDYKMMRGVQKIGELLWSVAVPFLLLLNILKKGEGIHIVAKKTE